MAAQAIIGIGLYVWTALALAAVFAKAGVESWKAWVPVLNGWTLFVLAGMRGWWAAVLGGAAVVMGTTSLLVGGALAGAALEASFGGDTSGAQAAALAAAVVPALLWLVVLVPALILHVRMLVGLCRRFGLGTGSVVLGVFLFPVWASVVGWGSARWLGEAGRTGNVRAEAEPAASPSVSPTPVVPALADFSPRPTASPAFGHVPVYGPGGSGSAPVASSPASPTTSPAFSAPPAFGAPSRPASNPWAPPVASAAAATPASTPAAANPAVPARPSAAAFAGADAEGVEDRTVIAGRRVPGWTLQLPGGAAVALTGDAAVLGRNPVAPARAPHAQIVAIDDVTRTVSKTHALLSQSATGWVITDLDSTNGVFVGPSPDDGSEVVGSAAVEGPFFLGDAALSLRNDG